MNIRLKWLAFDVYATLVDRENGGPRGFAEILKKYGCTNDPYEFFQEWHKATVRTYRGQFMKYKDAGLIGLIEMYSKYRINGNPEKDILVFFESMKNWAPFPDVKPVLSKLKKQFKLAAITNMDTDLFEKTPIGITFDVVVTSEMAKAYKPHPKIYQYALKKMRCKPQQILFVGTAPWADIVGAKLAGLKVAWINRSSPSVFQSGLDPWTPRPDYEFKDLYGLQDLLEGGSKNENA
jgi:2-haloacid dehalogenase